MLAGVLDNPSWEAEPPELQPTDIRGMSEADSGQSEGNRTLSWIWKARGVGAIGDDNEFILSEGKYRHFTDEDLALIIHSLAYRMVQVESTRQPMGRRGRTLARGDAPSRRISFLVCSVVGGAGRSQDWLDRSRTGGYAGICQTPGCDALWSVIPVLLQLLSPVAP